MNSNYRKTCKKKKVEAFSENNFQLVSRCELQLLKVAALVNAGQEMFNNPNLFAKPAAVFILSTTFKKYCNSFCFRERKMT